MNREQQRREQEIYARLDNLEGCEDNPVYAKEIRKLREELETLHREAEEFWDDPMTQWLGFSY